MVGVKQFSLLSFSCERLACEHFPFAVVDDNVSPCDFIFGGNFISENDLKIKFPPLQCYVINALEADNCLLTGAAGILCAVHAGRDSVVSDNDTDEPVVEILEEDSRLATQQGKILLSQLFDQTSICELQKRDYLLSQLCRHILDHHSLQQLSPRLTRYRRYLSNLKLFGQTLICNGSGGDKYVASFNFLVEITLTLHYKISHIGRLTKLVNIVNKHVWHPSLYKVVEDVCFSCEQCQKMKVSPQTVKPPILKIEASQPFELVGVDLISLPRTQSGNIGCSVVIDHYSKWLSMIPIKDKKSNYIAKLFGNVVLPSLVKCPDR